jgi:hypothetical protein
MAEKSLTERQAEMRRRLADARKNQNKLGIIEEQRPAAQTDLSPSARFKQENGSTVVSRDGLYDLVWTEPVMKLAARFGVSDVAVAKACRKYRIPLPGRGYWARIAAGQMMNKTPLPKGENETITFTVDGRETPAPIKSSLQISVPVTMRNLHPMAAKTYAELQQQIKSKDWGRYGQNWGRTSASSDFLNIRVTPIQLDRAVRIASAVLSAAADRGYVLRLSDRQEYGRNRRVEFVVEGVPITLEMFEPVSQTKHVPTAAEQRELDRGSYWRVPEYDFVSTGKQRLTLSPPRGFDKSFADTRDQKLEDMLAACRTYVGESHKNQRFCAVIGGIRWDVGEIRHGRSDGRLICCFFRHRRGLSQAANSSFLLSQVE